MKENTTQQNRTQPQSANFRHTRDFEDMPDSGQLVVEHLTIPGFLRRIPYRWHMNDIQRFGREVGKTAEALCVAFVTTLDLSLGTVRVFPVPLLRRCYEVLAAQFSWPAFTVALPAGGEAGVTAEETLRSHARLAAMLQPIYEGTKDMQVNRSVANVLDWLEADSTRIRAELER